MRFAITYAIISLAVTLAGVILFRAYPTAMNAFPLWAQFIISTALGIGTGSSIWTLQRYISTWRQYRRFAHRNSDVYH